MEIAPDIHSQFSPNLADFSACVLPTLQHGTWLKISFPFLQFCVPVISQKHNQVVELVVPFSSLSYPSHLG